MQKIEIHIANVKEAEPLLRIRNCPTFTNIVEKTNAAYLEKYERGNPLGNWLNGSKELARMSHKGLLKEKHNRINSLLEKFYPKDTISNRLKKRFLSRILQKSKHIILPMHHIRTDINVFCFTLPKHSYQTFCWVARHPVYQGFASELHLREYTLFDMVTVSCDQKIGDGMPPEQVQIHEATHCVDIMRKFREKSESTLLSEMIAVLGEGAVQEKQNWTLKVADTYFIGYFTTAIVSAPKDKLLRLFGIKQTNVINIEYFSKQAAHFIESLSGQINNLDLMHLFMHCQSFSELYEELQTRFPNYFSSDGYFNFPKRVN